MDDPARRRTLSKQSVVPDGLNATLVLLRHGESTAIVDGLFQGQLDTPLSPVGRRQAALAGARLAGPLATPVLPVPPGPPVEIVHSPLARAAQTAQAVAAAASRPDAFGRPIPRRPDSGFMEVAQGEWEGRPATEIVERWPDVLDAWHRRPTEAWAPGGESLADVDARVRPALRVALDCVVPNQAVAPAEPSHRLGSGDTPDGAWSILVAHAGVMRIVLLTLFELPLERFWIFPFDLCGITIVELIDGQPRLRAHNLTEHLAPLLEERAIAVSEERERTGAL